MNYRQPVISLLCLMLLLAGPASYGQDVPDSKGRDFWLTFLPNFHNGESTGLNDQVSRKEHELQIYIGAERPTRGTITWRRIDGSTQSQPFVITDIRVLHRFAIFYQDIELRGFSRSGAPLDFNNSQNEVVAPQHFHIQSEDDVTVYALNQAPLTSEAFLVLPKDALGDDYVVMSYTTDIGPSSTQTTNQNTTPSQFAVVATEDSTVVVIRPSVPTIKNPTASPDTVLLQQGDSYLVQADPRRDNRGDVTGSIVRATKPVAVFAGHTRAIIPIELRAELTSRDCLIEQMSPVQTWGKSAFVTPLASPTDDRDIGYDLYRVVAAFDSTEVYVDGQLRKVLMEGDYYEEKLLGAYEITTSRPSLTAQFKKSSGVPGGVTDTYEYADPFMMLVPPAEQFMTSYRFISIQSYQYEQFFNQIRVVDSVYKEQWLNVVIPTARIASLRLDGAPIPAGRFSQIGTSGYSFAQVPMRDGVHEILADTLFGIYVYGYGAAVSYGYIGGMAFRPLDVYPPVYLGSYGCDGFTGRIADSVIADTKVRFINTIPNSDTNTVLLLDQFAPPQSVVPFSVRLRDPYLDGSITLEAIDGVAQKNRQKIDIPGFTVSIRGLRQDPSLVPRQSVVAVGRERCDSIEIENYGRYSHTFVASFTGASRVDAPQPLTLAPGERRMLRYCRTGTTTQTVTDTLVFVDSCTRRPVAEMVFEEREDKLGPEIELLGDQCDSVLVVEMSDERSSDIGLLTVRILDSVLANCRVEQVLNQPLIKRYRISAIDRYRDVVYGFEAVDSVGNRSVRIDTIPGFLMSIAGSLGPIVRFDFGVHELGTVVCDTLPLKNFGITTLDFENVYLYGNTLFSVPQSQFGMTLQPSGEQSLIVCFTPLIADTTRDVSDTIDVQANCLIRRVILTGRGKGLKYQGVGRCDVPINVTVRELGRPLIAPNPVSDGFVVSFAQNEIQACTVRLIDLWGSVVLERSWAGAATSAIRVECPDVPNGHYTCQIVTDSVDVLPLIIAR